VGALPVGENDRLIGMITDRDIVMRTVAEDLSPRGTTVRQVMSNKICYCFDEDDLEGVADLMAEHQIRRLPVVNRQKRLVGMIALADLSQAQSDTAMLALKGISRPSVESRQMSR